MTSFILTSSSPHLTSSCHRQRLAETASEEEHLIVLDKLTSGLLMKKHNFHDIEDAITSSSAHKQSRE